MSLASTAKISGVPTPSTINAAGKRRESLDSVTHACAKGSASLSTSPDNSGRCIRAARGFARNSIVARSSPRGWLTTQAVRSVLSIPSTLARVPVMTSRGALVPVRVSKPRCSGVSASAANINKLASPAWTRTSAPRRNSEMARSTGIRGSEVAKMKERIR